MKILVGTTDGAYEPAARSSPWLSGREVRGLSSVEGHWWCIVNRQEIWSLTPGSEWRRRAGFRDPVARCLLPISNRVLVGTSEPDLYILEGQSLAPVAGFGGFADRDSWWSPGGGPAEVRSMALGSGGRIFANVHVGGILRSSDEGRSWVQTIDVDSDVHQVVFDSESGLLVAATAIGLAVSCDAGDHWKFCAKGLHASYLRAVAVTDRFILVTASTGPETRHAAVYRTAVGGPGVLERCTVGLPERFSDNINTFCLAARGSTAVIGTSEGLVYESADSGVTWREIARGFSAIRCVSLELAQSPAQSGATPEAGA